MILINASNIKVGGGLQVATSVIDFIIKNENIDQFVLVVSHQVYEGLGTSVRDISLPVYICDLNPFSIRSILSSRKLLDSLEVKYSIDKVFSIFGPTFWTPKRAKHFIGFANAWLVNLYNRAYSIFPLHRRYLMILKNYVLSKLVYDENAIYFTETESIKEAFSDKFGHNDIYVVDNTISHLFFQDCSRIQKNKLHDLKGYKFLTITHNYPHKNMATIGRVGAELSARGYEVVFIVTFSDDEYEKQTYDFKKYTHNVGVVSIEQCQELYLSVNALYLPTLIECFTVSYLEAMATNTPIATSNLPFAIDICKDSGYYFDPYCIDSIVACLIKLIEDTETGAVKRNISQYHDILLEYKDNAHRVREYLKIIRER